MQGLILFDVAIGLMLLYFLLSTICTVLMEAYAQIKALRAKALERGIAQLLGGEGPVFGKFKAHALYTALMDGKAGPSYVPARLFATVLLDVIRSWEDNGTTMGLRKAIHDPRNKAVKQALAALLEEADGRADLFREHIESWYNDSMDRVSGWYRRKTRKCILIVAGVITVFANIDSIRVAEALYRDPGLRAVLVARAEKVTETTSSGQQTATPRSGAVADDTQSVLAELNGMGLPIGWKEFKCSGNLWGLLLGILALLPGWLTTIAAVSLGAPFWFDLLNKFVNLRSAGRVPEETPRNPPTPAKTDDTYGAYVPREIQ